MKKLIKTIGVNWSLNQFLTKMKLTLAFLLIGLLTASASTYSQNTKLDVSFKNNSIIELFHEIEEQSEFYFFYKKEELTGLDNISVDVKGAKVTEILDEVINGTSLNYKIVDRYIIVSNSMADVEDMVLKASYIRDGDRYW